MRAHRSNVLGIVLLLIASQVPAAVAQESDPPSVDRPALMEQTKHGEVCAWPVEVAVDALNVAYPETKASYFVMPSMLAPGQSLLATGPYRFGRFSSLATYLGLGQPGRDIDVLGWLRDSEIVPAEGSGDPAMDAAAPPTRSSANGRSGWPTRSRSTRCSCDATAIRCVCGRDCRAGARTRAQAAVEGNVIPAHPEGKQDQLGIVVVRGQAPALPDASAGESLTGPRQLRFWSFCTGSNDVTPPEGYPTTACVADQDIPVGRMAGTPWSCRRPETGRRAPRRRTASRDSRVPTRRCPTSCCCGTCCRPRTTSTSRPGRCRS